jgi:hypothetical protein
MEDFAGEINQVSVGTTPSIEKTIEPRRYILYTNGSGVCKVCPM